MFFSPLVFSKVLGTASIGAFTIGVATSSEFLSHLKWQQQQQQQPSGFTTSSVGFQRALRFVRIGLAGLVAVPVVAFTGAAIADWQPYLVYSLGLVGYAGVRFATAVLPLIERQTSPPSSGEIEADKSVIVEEKLSPKEDIEASSPSLTESVYKIDKRDYEDTEDEAETEATEIAAEESAELIADGVIENNDSSLKFDELQLREFRKQRLIATVLSGVSFLIALVGVAGETR